MSGCACDPAPPEIGGATHQPWCGGHEPFSMDYQCEKCGLAAIDLPKGVDPEYVFAPDEHGRTVCAVNCDA